MALSPKARIAAVGGALAIGVLGAGGAAYASGSGPAPAPAQYVTTVDDGAGNSPEDCPEGAGGSGSGADGAGATGTPGDA
jgi:hypothetical protein